MCSRWLCTSNLDFETRNSLLHTLSGSVENPADVLNDHGAGLNLFNNPQRGREEIAFVEFPQLPSSLRERRARKSCRHNIYLASEWLGIEGIQVFFDDIPLWAVETQRLARMRIKFHQANVGKTGRSKPSAWPPAPAHNSRTEMALITHIVH
jgi:hypothetical protein